MKYLISVGHTASGNVGCGAVGYLNESNCTREIVPLIVSKLKSSISIDIHSLIRMPQYCKIVTIQKFLLVSKLFRLLQLSSKMSCLNFCISSWVTLQGFIPFF